MTRHDFRALFAPVTLARPCGELVTDSPEFQAQIAEVMADFCTPARMTAADREAEADALERFLEE